MIPLTDPFAVRYLAAYRADPCPATACMLVDAVELDGQLPGLGLPDLCYWLARCQDDDVAAIKVALSAWDGSHGRRARGEFVRASGIRKVVSHFDYYGAFEIWAPEPETGEMKKAVRFFGPLPQDVQEGEAFAYRDLRRRLLALYPEVECRIEARFEKREHLRQSTTASQAGTWGDWWDRLLTKHGFRLEQPYCQRIESESDVTDREWIYRQTLCASELIPPK